VLRKHHLQVVQVGVSSAGVWPLPGLCCLQEPFLRSILEGHPRQKQLLSGLPVDHQRLFFTWLPPKTARDTTWEVKVLQMLVDAEALEALWRQLQPGTTLALRTQVSGVVLSWLLCQ
jgi:hypothetical protein